MTILLPYKTKFAPLRIVKFYIFKDPTLHLNSSRSMLKQNLIHHTDTKWNGMFNDIYSAVPFGKMISHLTHLF